MMENISSNSNDSTLSSQIITPAFKSNDLNDQCYCLKSRNFEEVELQCCVCAKWFHRNCIDIDTGPLAKFLTNYQFFCKNCGNNRQESFSKKQASFHQLCVTTLANLAYENQQTSKQFYSRDKDIIPFIDKQWEAMTCAPRRTKSTWHATVSRTLGREEVFITKIENNEMVYRLRDNSFEKIGPFNENYKLMMNQTSKQTLGETTSFVNNSLASTNTQSSKRGSKRKVNETSSIGFSAQSGTNSNSANSRKRGGGNDLSRLEKMVPTCFPVDHPFNKDGYRYHLVEPDPHSPMRQKFEETELWAGKPLPGHLYRLFLENRVALSLHDRAPQLKLNEDRTCVIGEKGYSMVRATHGAGSGAWYFEVFVKEKPNNSALRIGWAQHLANLQAPCGYDKFSYSWRSRKGTRFHDSIGKSYSRLVDQNNGGYDQGDVLGFYINLPLKDNSKLLPECCKDMTLVKFKNHLYYEEKDNFSGAEKKLTPLEGSKIEFFKNGISQGIAYTNIYQGTYYPAISLYKNSSVVVNFGPNFKYPIEDTEHKFRPISDLAAEKFVEYSLSDLAYHVTHDGSFE